MRCDAAAIAQLTTWLGSPMLLPPFATTKEKMKQREHARDWLMDASFFFTLKFIFFFVFVYSPCLSLGCRHDCSLLLATVAAILCDGRRHMCEEES